MISTTIISQKIADNHYQEWKNSGVSDEIIFNNVTTIYDQLEVDKLLNRRLKKMWNRPIDLVPCWAVSGVDPVDDMPTNQGVQVKPIVPRIGENGKPIKYEGARNAETTPLFLDMGEGYWQSKVEDVHQPIIITEGGKKAGALLSHGFTAISIPGVTTCRKKGRLHQNLELFAKLGRKFYLCFDNDLLYKEPVQKALIGLGKELATSLSKVYIVQLPEGTAKGADDYLVAYGKDNFQSLVDNALTFEEWLEEIKSSEPEQEDTVIKSKLAKYFHLVDKNWGANLRYNSLKHQVELFGNELDEDEVRLIMALQFDIDIASSDAQIITRKLAKRDEYSPLCDYLDECSSKYPDIDTSFLDNLAFEYFGTSDPIHATYFKKFLVSAVARARKPGDQVDHVLMLISPEQGKKKSTFFRNLFGKDFFSDQLGTDISSKDEKMKISKYWCLEWSEFESIYKKKDVAALKAFITWPSDCFRAPYARREAEHPRPCVFVGTSNQTEILHDPTGDRRFWIIPVTTEEIPLDKVRADRDKIWAAANALHRAGFKWYLDKNEEKIRDEKNQDYRTSTIWDDIIANLWEKMLRPNHLHTETILKELGFADPKDVRGFVQKELNETMMRLGWKKLKNPRRFDGEQRRGWWVKSDYSDSLENSSDNQGVTEGSGVTPLPDKDSSRYTPDTPLKNGCNSVTSDEFDNLLPVTPVTDRKVTVTEVYQPELLCSKGVTPDSLVTPQTQDFLEKEKLLKEVQVNVELFRMALADDSYEMITQLVESWSQDFKKAVFAMLTNEEQEQARKLRNQHLPPQEIVKKMAEEVLGKREEGMAIAPGILEKREEAPLFKEGDIIKPIQGRDKNKQFIVTSFTDGRVYGRPKSGMIKSFLPHEVVKL